METLDIISIAFCTAFAVIGLVLIILQKKGIVKPVLTATAQGVDFISGGMILLMGTVFGTMLLSRFSTLYATLYAGVFLILYVVIQLLFKK